MSSTIANNDDLLIEIVRHLPTESLLNFKLISKLWKSIISCRQFFRRRYPLSGLILYRNPSLDFVTLKNSPTSIPYLSLIPPDIKYSELKIWQSCNGLLLCSRYCPPYPFSEEYFLYNPTTIQFVTIRPPPDAAVGYGVKTLRIVVGMSLAYDPAISPGYKLVCLSFFPSLSRISDDLVTYQIDVYSSETGLWRFATYPFPAPDNLEFLRGVFCNGSIHWINHHNDSLFFNVDEEQLRIMPMPQHSVEEDEGRKCKSFRYFGESNKHLHLVEYYDSGATKFDVYEMERDYSGWFVKYRVDLDGIIAAFPNLIREYNETSEINYHCKFTILSVVREANDEESYMVLHIPGKAIRYNLIDNSFSHICDLAQSHKDIRASLKYRWFDAHQHIENFACF